MSEDQLRGSSPVHSRAGNLYAPCLMLLIHPLWGQVGGGWALEIETFLGPLIWHKAGRRVPFGAQPPPTCPSNGCCPHQKNYAQGRINHRCIGSFIYKSSRVTLKGYLREVSGPIPPLQWGLKALTQITALLPPHPPPIQNLLEINRKL